MCGLQLPLQSHGLRLQAAQSLEVQLAALAAWETYIFGRLKTFKVPFQPPRS
jgi:hypothetical protein